MEENPPLVDFGRIEPDEAAEAAALTEKDVPGEVRPTVWISRVTSIVGLICLALALFEWAIRPNHFRLVLALLVVAMFAAILHSYTFENG